ncbi:DMT family transporter [Desulfospira joergensenii]|uniref:DMT family transporter n=1 Tax=Desulfospira joergensenii TaxID=53329 RepID=UPI0003B4520E|nr:DMT family transporter [Desulfospira joergensenii]
MFSSRPKLNAVTILVAGAAMISFSGVWVKLAHVSPTASAFYRVFFGCLFLLPGVLIQRESFAKPFKKYLMAALSSVFFAMDLFCWHKSILFIGPGLATILGNFQVFGLTLVGILFFREKLRLVFIFSLPLAMLGLYLIIGVNWDTLGPESRIGILYGFATAACYIGYLLTLKQLQSDAKNQSRFFYMMLVSLFSSLFLGGILAAGGDSFAIPDIQSLFSLFALGLFSQCIGWVMIANAMPHVRTSRTGLILLLQPLLAFVWDVLFFARPTGMTNWIGVLLTLSAIYMGMAGKGDKAIPAD